jgi:hypothetical protein
VDCIPDLHTQKKTTGTLDAARIPALDTAKITTGTLDAARIPTLNQNTSGSAATLTTAQTIGGVSFDGSAAIVPTTFTTATFSGDVTVDSTTFHVDSTNNRVGIGTNSPQSPFHVNPINGTTDSENAFLDFRREFSPHGHLGIFATETHTNAVGPDLRFKGSIYNGTSNPTIRQVMCLKPTGNVGIGTTTPEAKLHVKGGSICVHRTFPDTPDAGIVFMEDHSNKDCMFIAYDAGGTAETDDERLSFYSKSAGGADPTISGAKLLMCMRADGNVGIGTTSPACPFHVKFSTNAARSSGNRFEDANSTNYWENWINNGDYFYFSYNGSDRGWIQGPNGPAATKMPNFTGQHMTFIKDIPFTRATECEGLIVSSDQNKYIKMNEGIETGSNAITINECLPVVSLSNVTSDKKCFGVISASEDPETRTVLYGAWGSVAEKEKGDTRVYINSVGEGAIWVTDINGSLESGDYITTSNVAGYGQKQESDSLKNYTVAKITMDCDFSPVTQPIQNIKKDETGENTLDEHGQIQWEDHATETEKAYKIRYLDANGVITDEANAVHTAAFVGCTYHCG